MFKMKKNEFSSSSYSSSSLSSDEEVDARDLKPIKDYLSNRRELARQLFKSVKPEKIRMMLPQILKKVDLNELEEWCASELSGMSKTRILCILSGKPMLESSDTSESDDSGPSLEIISDTEEWLTDDEIPKQEEGLSGKLKIKKDKSKFKKKSQTQRKNDLEKSKPRSKTGNNDRYEDVKIKKEEEKEGGNKEGDSLLDLLELEMRARAIRALIRKEEDIIPNSDSPKTSTNNTALKEQKTVQEELQEKENCRRQLERIINSKQASTCEDEDVVLVVQPTPTIELLSSESEEEGHSGVRINKKLENERVIEMQENTNHMREETVKNDNNIENKEKGTNTVNKNTSNETLISNNVETKGSQSPSMTQTDNGTEKRRKAKKKSHTKELSKSHIQVEEFCKSSPNKTDDKTNDENVQEYITPTNTVEKQEVPECIDNSVIESEKSKDTDNRNKTILEEEKGTDLEEIIDLDDYCDDMDDMENCDNDKSKNKTPVSSLSVTEQFNVTKPQAKIMIQKSGSNETWATRYYQTDDVQNVIKESKIQSEIRKRLRERQRLSKLNKSPSLNIISIASTSESNIEKTEQKPTGSVEEYLALKRNVQMTLSTSNSGDFAPEKSALTEAPTESTPENMENDKSKVPEKETCIDISNINEDINIQTPSTTEQAQKLDFNNETKPE